MILKSNIPTVNEQEKKIFIMDAPLLIVLGILSTIFQVVSGWTEWIGLSAALVDYLGDKGSKTIAFIIALSIEMGVLGLVTYIVNGLYDEYLSDKEFTDKQKKANKVKFGQMSIFLLILVSISMFLSKNNARMALQANPIKPKTEDIAHFNEEQDRRTSKIENRYKSDKADLSNWQRDSKQAIKQRYDTKVNTIEEELKIIERKEERTGQRYTTKKASLRKQIATHKEKEAEELGTIDQEHRTKLSSIMQDRNKNITSVKLDVARRKEPIIDRNNGIIANNKDYSITVANFLSSYAQFSVLGFLICWSWICVSLNTCGIKPKLFVSKEYFESSLIKELWTLISTSISRPIRNGIRKRLSNIKPLIPLESSEAIYSISEGSPPLAVASLNNTPQKRTIGFKSNIEPDTVAANVDDLTNTLLDKGSGDTSCIHCGSLFWKKNHRHKFCKTDCRMTYWENNNDKKLKRGRKKD